MPKTDMKVKSGNKYPVTYVVTGSLSDLTREQVEVLAVRYLRNAARTFCVQKLNESEAAILGNRKVFDGMLAVNPATGKPMATVEEAKAFFAMMKMPLEIPGDFQIPITELIPDAEGGRGKKAADIFSVSEVEEDEDSEETVTQ